MRSIAGLFGRSPFKLLEKHMEKVKDAMREDPPLFDALYATDYGLVKEVSEKILKFEHEADNLKNDIRSQIPNSLFMPVDRRDFLNLLSFLNSKAYPISFLRFFLHLPSLFFLDFCLSQKNFPYLYP